MGSGARTNLQPYPRTTSTGPDRSRLAPKDDEDDHAHLAALAERSRFRIVEPLDRRGGVVECEAGVWRCRDRRRLRASFHDRCRPPIAGGSRRLRTSSSSHVQTGLSASEVPPPARGIVLPGTPALRYQERRDSRSCEPAVTYSSVVRCWSAVRAADDRALTPGLASQRHLTGQPSTSTVAISCGGSLPAGSLSQPD